MFSKKLAAWLILLPAMLVVTGCDRKEKAAEGEKAAEAYAEEKKDAKSGEESVASEGGEEDALAKAIEHVESGGVEGAA